MFGYYDYKTMFSPDEILVYLRKSRSDDPILSVEEVLQKHETILDDWATQNLDKKIPEANKYREVMSGETIEDRPKMQEVLRKIESPKYKAILCVEIQRLSRGDLIDAGVLIRTLRYTNTYVITPQKTYDLQDEYDRDIFERELKRGNEYLEYQKKIMNRGRLLSVQQGNYLGSHPPYGYDRTWVLDGKKKCPTLKINEEQANVVRMIFDMYVKQDMGRVNICHKLDDMGITPPKGKRWSPAALKDTLENVHYIGKVRWYWRKTVTVIEEGEARKTNPKSKKGECLIYDGKHEGIIPEDLFWAAQEKQGRNHRAKPTTKIRNPLAGLLYCQCGRAMSLRTYRQNGKERAPARLLCDDQVHCGTGSCVYDEMMERVMDILSKCIEDFEIKLTNDTGNSVELHNQLIKNLEKKLKELDAKELAQWEAQSDPDPDVRMPPDIFKRLREKLLKDKAEIRQALNNAYESMPEPVNYEEKVVRFRKALDALTDPDVGAQEKNTLLKACIERIEYNRKAPERTRSQKVRYYDPETKKRKCKSPLTTGGNWTTYPIEIDVKLRV